MMSYNSSIYVENLQQANQDYTKTDQAKKSQLCKKVAQNILAQINKKKVLRNNHVQFSITWKGVIYDNDKRLSLGEYVSCAKFYDEVTQTLQLTGSSAISVATINITSADCMDLGELDHAGCCFCCPCIYFPYMIHKKYNGLSYNFLVKLKVNI